MSEHVPTTDEIRDDYAHMIAPHTTWGEDGFERWLDQVKADAWDAGAQAQAAAYGMDKDTGPNPYRQEAGQ